MKNIAIVWKKVGEGCHAMQLYFIRRSNDCKTPIHGRLRRVHSVEPVWISIEVPMSPVTIGRLGHWEKLSLKILSWPKDTLKTIYLCTYSSKCDSRYRRPSLDERRPRGTYSTTREVASACVHSHTQTHWTPRGGGGGGGRAWGGWLGLPTPAIIQELQAHQPSLRAPTDTSPASS